MLYIYALLFMLTIWKTCINALTLVCGFMFCDASWIFDALWTKSKMTNETVHRTFCMGL